MKRVKINGLEVEIYDSILDTPADRFEAYNRAIQIDSGVGSDLEAFDNRCNSIVNFIATNPQAAVREINAMRQTVRFTMSKVNTKSRAFAYLVKSIEGKPYPISLSDTDVDEIIQRVNKRGMTMRMLDRILEQVKKKRAGR